MPGAREPGAPELPQVLARPRVARARRLEPGRVRLERARPVTRRPAPAGPARTQRRLRRLPIRRRTISIPVAVPPVATRPARRTGPARRTIRQCRILRGRRPARLNRTQAPATLRMAFPSVRPGRDRARLNSQSVPSGRRRLRGASIGPEHRIASRWRIPMQGNKSRLWSEEEDERLLALDEKNEPPKRISILLGRSERAVALRLKELDRRRRRGSARQ